MTTQPRGRSSAELPELVEHMQGDLAVMRLRVAERAKAASPDDSAALLHEITILAASLGNLRRILRRFECNPKQGEKHGHR
jgi:hypothetical protein